MMKKYFKQMQPHTNLRGAMETGDHSKNGTSPKSHTSRERFVFFGFLSITLFLLYACGKEKEPQPFINLDITTVDFESEGGSRTVQVSSNSEWSISGEKSWCEVSPKTGKGNVSVTINVSKNDSFEDRETNLSFECGEANAILEIFQWGSERNNYNYVDMNWDKNTVTGYDENTGRISVQYQGALPAIEKNRAIILPEEYEYDIRVIKDYSVSGNTVTVQTVQGTMSNIFMNISFTLSTDPSLSSVQTKSGHRNRVITPSKIEAATENGGYVTIYDKSISTKSGYEDSFDIFSFNKNYSGENLYSSNGHRVFWEKCVFDIGMKGVFSFDFGQTIIDNIPWGDLETFEFYLDGRLNIDLLLKYVFAAQIKEGKDVLVKMDAIPMLKFTFIVGTPPLGVPVTVFVFTNLYKKYDMEANAEITMNAGFNMQANAKAGLRYTKNGGVSPITSFTSSFTPYAPTFTANGSLAAKGSIYPRIEFQIYKILCPWVDFIPYLSGNFEGGIRESTDGNNYLAWTSKTNAGVDCRMGFKIETSIFLPLIDVWKSGIYNLVDMNLFDMPKRIELALPKNGTKLNIGEPVDVSFYVASLNNITGNYFPCIGGSVNFVTDGETDKTVAVSGLDGMVTVKWKPKSKVDVLTAKIVNRYGETISEATFTPEYNYSFEGKWEGTYTCNSCEKEEYCGNTHDLYLTLFSNGEARVSHWGFNSWNGTSQYTATENNITVVQTENLNVKCLDGNVISDTVDVIYEGTMIDENTIVGNYSGWCAVGSNNDCTAVKIYLSTGTFILHRTE
jgi:hypothetical protein